MVSFGRSSEKHLLDRIQERETERYGAEEAALSRSYREALGEEYEGAWHEEAGISYPGRDDDDDRRSRSSLPYAVDDDGPLPPILPWQIRRPKRTPQWKIDEEARIEAILHDEPPEDPWAPTAPPEPELTARDVLISALQADQRWRQGGSVAERAAIIADIVSRVWG